MKESPIKKNIGVTYSVNRRCDAASLTWRCCISTGYARGEGESGEKHDI